MSDTTYQPGEIVPRCGTAVDVYVGDVSDVTLSGYQSTQWPEGRLISIHNEAPGVICLRLVLWAGDRLKVQPSGWQPIESAPKDGTPIDAWITNGSDEGYRLADVAWMRHPHVCISQYCDSCPKDLEVEAWREPIGCYQVKPSFWRPVPDAPRVTGEGRTK